MISLKVFKDQMIDLVWLFEDYWLSESKKALDDFPMDMPTEEWHEQFIVWLSMQ